MQTEGLIAAITNVCKQIIFGIHSKLQEIIIDLTNGGGLESVLPKLPEKFYPILGVIIALGLVCLIFTVFKRFSKIAVFIVATILIVMILSCVMPSLNLSSLFPPAIQIPPVV